MTIVQAEASLVTCRHCGLAAKPGLEFCCAGCAEVHALLMSRGLGHFYRLQENHSFRPPQPAPRGPVAPIPDTPGGEPFVRRFYLEGIHCLGCLWLLEKLPGLEKGILEARLDMNHQILEVRIDPGITSWNEVVAWISRLGYSAKPLEEEKNFLESRRRDRISSLSRLGVAAFCTGNIMLLTVSIYAGSDAFWSRNFGLLSAVLALPVLTYSAWPLYRSAFVPLRKGRISIDLAIVLAIFSGIAMSAWSLARGSSEGIYLDSLSMLVFLLLASRAFLQRMRESLADEAPALAFAADERYARRGPSGEEFVVAAQLLPGDIFRLEAGQVLPVDAVLRSAGQCYFDLSLLTGESMPVKHLMGDRVEAGSRITSGKADFCASAPASESRLAKILAQIRAYELHRSPSVEFADRMGRRFVGVVLGIASFLLLWMPNAEGMSRALALAIVTCPCVLAFAIPLTLTRALQRAARIGVLFRDAGKLETLAGTKNIFFDKTGTLTNGEFQVISWVAAQGNQEEAKRAAFWLESSASHPVGKAIARYFAKEIGANPAPVNVRDFLEIPGEGVRGTIDGNEWKIARAKTTATPGQNRVTVTRNRSPIAEITLGDKLRDDAGSAVEKLLARRYSLHLLSGDTPANAGVIARKLGIQKWHGALSPEKKAGLVSSYAHTLMVGDGANDAVAFRAASVSVAMQGAVELSLRHCDVMLTKPGLESLPRALRLAEKTMALVRTNFAFTLAYNIAAGSLAVTGNMSPLFAALLMPLSALTVFLFTTLRTSREDFA